MTTLIDIQKDLDQIQKKRLKNALMNMAKPKQPNRKIRVANSKKRQQSKPEQEETNQKKAKQKKIIIDGKRDYLKEDQVKRESGKEIKGRVGSGNKTPEEIKEAAKKQGFNKKLNPKKDVNAKGAVSSKGKNEKTNTNTLDTDKPENKGDQSVQTMLDTKNQKQGRGEDKRAFSTTRGTGTVRENVPKVGDKISDTTKKILSKKPAKNAPFKRHKVTATSKPETNDTGLSIDENLENKPVKIQSTLHERNAKRDANIKAGRLSTAGMLGGDRETNQQVKEITQSFTRITAQVQGLRDISKQKTLVNNIGIMEGIFKSHYKIKGQAPLKVETRQGAQHPDKPSQLTATTGNVQNQQTGRTMPKTSTPYRDSFTSFEHGGTTTGTQNHPESDSTSGNILNMQHQLEQNKQSKNKPPSAEAQRASYTDADKKRMEHAEGNIDPDDPNQKTAIPEKAAPKKRGSNKKKKIIKKSLRLINQTNKINNIINKMGMISHRDGSTTSYDKKFDASVDAGLARHAAKLEKDPYAGKFDPTKSPQYDGKTGKFIGKRPQEKDLKRWTPQPIKQSTSQALHKLIADVRKVTTDIQGNPIGDKVTQGVKWLTQGKYKEKPLGTDKDDQKVLST